jgi:hypothetical protein
VLLEALAALALLPSAPASTYVGETDQGYPARAVVRAGVIDRIRLRWVAPCQTPGYAWGPQGTVWFNRQPAPYTMTGDRFSDGGTNRFRFRGGRAVMTQRLSGRFVDGEFISGVQSTRVRVYSRSGEKLDSCSSRVRFRVTPAAPMQVSPGLPAG